MLTLANHQLAVSVLDPVADQERFGTRYCTGGYIFQVADHRLGDLLSGPTYPDSFNVFDGQGIPDAFNLLPLRDPYSADPTSLIVGIGVCDTKANRVQQFCRWEVERRDDRLRLVTEQRFQGYALRLEREVALMERTVRSAIRVVNLEKGFLNLRWFPHPFFPHPVTDDLFRVNFPVAFPEDPSFELGPNGYIRRKVSPWKGGQTRLDHGGDTRLVVMQRHPKVGMVTATCSFAPDFFLIWGNTRTFSWEPYLERSLLGAQELAWSIDYDF
ncbi:MAG: hypothetical protein ABIL09_15945 [Gemmatimonadota bacterium]